MLHPVHRCRPAAVATALLATVVVLSAPRQAYAQADSAETCPNGRISRIVIDNRSIFETDSARSPSWIARLANALHVKTRASFIRRELLFREGDCYDPFLLEESGRLLRGYDFLAQADVRAADRPDGSKQVVVRTKDDWTTKVDLGVSVDAGLRLDVLDVSEENLLGRGILTSAFLRQRDERRDIGGRLGVPHLLGTRAIGSLQAGRTRVGTFLDQSVEYPFLGEVGRVSFRESYQRDDNLFPYSTGHTETYSHVLLPLLDKRVEVRAAGRVGHPGNLTTLGLGIARKTLDFEGFPANVEIARNSNFSGRDSAPPGVADLLADQTYGHSITSVEFLIGQSNVHFRRVRGLDALDGETDVRLGAEFDGSLARSVDVRREAGFPRADVMGARARLYGAGGIGSSLFFGNLQLQGRQFLSGGPDGDGWNDVIGELDVYAYLRSHRLPGQTIFARVSGAGGWSMTTPFQLTLGGRSNLRGLTIEDFPGGRRMLLTLEDRIFVRWPLPDVFDTGFTLFSDAGRVWAGDVPFGTDSGWRGTLGFGLRFGFPSGTRNVLRADLAFPVGVPGARGPVFRVTLKELLGLSAGFTDPQLDRSRR